MWYVEPRLVQARYYIRPLQQLKDAHQPQDLCLPYGALIPAVMSPDSLSIDVSLMQHCETYDS